MAIRTTIQCPRCGNRFDAVVDNVIDVAENPNAKARLLTGQLNTVQCPNCGTPSSVAVPLVYHDASKELLITFVPMELGLPKDQQQKVVGDLLRQATGHIPQEQFKGYLFQPREALTMQGLIEQVLQADGVTPEMMEAQRATVRLAEQFIQARDEDIPALVQQHDAQIDAQLFRTFAVIAQQLVQEGRPEVAQRVIDVQQQIIEHSSYGQQLLEQSAVQEQIVREVAEDIQALGQNAERKDFIDLAIRYAGDDERLQALVGLVRPAFDYQLLQEFTTRISQAPAAEREQLETVRDQVVELTAVIDQQQQMALQDAAALLRAMLSTPDPEPIIRENLGLVDDTFMAVLSANIQEAERQRDINASARLKALYEQIVTILRENMQPELRFINELLTAPTDDEARAMVPQGVEQYGPALLEMMEAVEEALASRGDERLMHRLDVLRAETQQALGQ